MFVVCSLGMCCLFTGYLLFVYWVFVVVFLVLGVYCVCTGNFMLSRITLIEVLFLNSRYSFYTCELKKEL